VIIAPSYTIFLTSDGSTFDLERGDEKFVSGSSVRWTYVKLSRQFIKLGDAIDST
jgi:hypothetical protein